MTHPGVPRDVDLAAWLDGFGFHPANTELKQLGHEVTRKLAAELAQTLFQILPPGREKSLVFSHLEQVLMFANKALAVGGGPGEHVTVEDLRALLDRLGSVPLPEDPRIKSYKAEQLAES